jgi:hypothetical protein
MLTTLKNVSNKSTVLDEAYELRYTQFFYMALVFIEFFLWVI